MRAVRMALYGCMLAMAAAGCRSKGVETSAAPDPDAAVPVEVENHYLADIVVYLVHGSQRQRLGMVTALSTATFTFPWRRLQASGSSRLLAYPIGGPAAHLSEALYLQPGQSISWTLETDLNRSSLAVY